MLLILQMLSELTLPLLTDSRLRQFAHGWILKIRGNLSERGTKHGHCER